MDGEIFFGQRDGSRIKIIFYDVTTMADSSFFFGLFTVVYGLDY